MKIVTYLTAFLFFSSYAFAQGHFVPAYTGNGQDHMSILVVSASINGVGLDAGDEIAAFDGTICCGIWILTQPIVMTSPSTFATIKASRKDDGQANGYTVGNAISYKFWDASANLELSGISAEYLDPAGNPVAAPTYSVGGSAIVKLSATSAINRQPIANAGSDQTANIGATVTLDGTASSDPDGNTITFSWTAPSGITLSSATASKPTFVAPEVATNTNFTFSLVVNDGTANSPADQVTITVLRNNLEPVANAGPDQSVNEGTTVALNGLASSDPNGDILSYFWTAPSGITLSSSSSSQPSFLAPEVAASTNFTFTLVVNDGIVNSSEDQVVITVNNVNKAPVANAGPDQSVTESTICTLDGSSSLDPDGDAISYLWTAPSGIILSSATAARPTFLAPDVSSNTNFTFALIVNDGQLNSSPDQITVTVRQDNKIPTSNAGPDQSVNEGTTVALNGSASSDPDSDPLSYFWTAPTGITLSSSTAANPTFVAPEVNVNTNYTFTLVVNDGTANSLTDQVTITVIQVNKPPIANSGSDQSVTEGTTVTLDGTGSSDPDGQQLTYSWTAPSGVILSSTSASKPTFVAPSVTTPTAFTFLLVVNDGVANSPADQVTITVRRGNQTPIANAGPDQSVAERAPVTLDGTASSDPDGNALTYLWVTPSGITLSSPTSSKPTFTAPEVTQDTPYTFSLIVNDGTINSLADQVLVTVLNVDRAPYVKDPIKNFSVNQGSLPKVVDLKTIFADDDSGDILNYQVSANSNNAIVSTIITEHYLILSFSTGNNGTSEVEISATSNGKTAKSAFMVDVKIPTGIELPTEDTEIKLYPNPTNGMVKLIFPTTPKAGTSVTLFDTSGKTLFKTLATKKEETIYLDNIPAGFYFIRIDEETPKLFKILLNE